MRRTATNLFMKLSEGASIVFLSQTDSVAKKMLVFLFGQLYRQVGRTAQFSRGVRRIVSRLVPRIRDFKNESRQTCVTMFFLQYCSAA